MYPSSEPSLPHRLTAKEHRHDDALSPARERMGNFPLARTRVGDTARKDRKEGERTIMESFGGEESMPMPPVRAASSP